MENSKSYRKSSKRDRVTDSVAIGTYIVEHRATIRQSAAHFGRSKSGTYEILINCLKIEKPLLFKEVRKVLDKNKAERHIRGGNATREKYSTHK